MSYYHLLKKALEIDLEEIGHLAMACKTAPIAVCHTLLGIIAEETQEACVWNTMLAHCYDGMKPGYPDPGGVCDPPPYYGDYDPFKEKDDYGKGKKG